MYCHRKNTYPHSTANTNIPFVVIVSSWYCLLIAIYAFKHSKSVISAAFQIQRNSKGKPFATSLFCARIHPGICFPLHLHNQPTNDRKPFWQYLWQQEEIYVSFINIYKVLALHKTAWDYAVVKNQLGDFKYFFKWQ